MFDNIGGKVKAIAMGVFVLEIVAAVISAIVFAVVAESFWPFLVILVAGVVIAYLSVMMLYAFGELVENTTVIARQVGKIAVSNASNAAEDTSYYTLLKRPANADFWICPNCRTSNHKTAGSCGCGARKPY